MDDITNLDGNLRSHISGDALLCPRPKHNGGDSWKKTSSAELGILEEWKGYLGDLWKRQFDRLWGPIWLDPGNFN
jgi:hypothetical protein